MSILYRLRRIWLLTPLLLVFIAGCASPQVDWGSRIGKYTYDQAVQELGAPRDSQTLPNGTHVAEWLTMRGTPRMVGFGMGGALATPGRLESHVPNDIPARPSQFLRLTFGSDGKLIARQQVAR